LEHFSGLPAHSTADGERAEDTRPCWLTIAQANDRFNPAPNTSAD
jgi:hypothetical protein